MSVSSLLVPHARTSQRISLDEIDSQVLIDGITFWHSRAKDRKYPSRSDVTPRALKSLLRNTMLMRVVDGGKDYEYRIVGDAYVMAHTTSFQGMAWSEIGHMAPRFQAYIKPIYDQVVREGQPVATRGWIERGSGSTGYVYCEYVYLPVGETDSVVDHILVFAVYLRRDGLEPVGNVYGAD